ncbi:MAG: hypothetical protein WCY11_09040 [Novosphingobium sp.]
MVMTPQQDRFRFEIDPFRRDCLLKGLDEIGMTLALNDLIATHEAKVRITTPWVSQSAETTIR